MTRIAVGNFSNNTKSKFQPFPDVPIPIKRFYGVPDILITNLHIVFSAYPVFKKFDFEENSGFFKFNPPYIHSYKNIFDFCSCRKIL